MPAVPGKVPDQPALAPEHAARLGALAERLLPALSVRDVVDVVTGPGLRALAADAVTVYLLDGAGTSLGLSGSAGYDGALRTRFETIAVDDPLPAAEVVRTGEPVSWADEAERDRRWPAMADYDRASDAAVVASLCDGARPLGILSVGWDRARDLAPEDVALAAAAARMCGQAIVRARQHDLEHRDLESERFLAAATRLVNESLDLDVTLRAVARLAVPAFADVCAVCLADDGGALRTVVVATDDPRRQDVLDRLVARQPLVQTPELLEVARTGVGRLVRDLDGSVASSYDDEEHQNLVRALDATSWLAVALRAQDDTVGLLIWVITGYRAPLEPSSLALAESLAGPAAAAIEHAQRFTELDERVEHLSHALSSRIVIEQAKGVLATRWQVDIPTAFDHMRALARARRQKVHDLAAEVIRGTDDLDPPS
jgi:GAF domain-containing protein